MILKFFSPLLIIFLYMNFWFILSIIKKRNDLADIAWGLGFILTAFIALINQDFASNRMFLIFFLVLIWGLRLFLHIFIRNKGKPEDYRYKKWRQDWGNYWLIRTYLQVFILQGLFMYLISLPIIFSGIYDIKSSLGLLDLLGLFVWLIGFYFEAVGDWQLTKFKLDPKNKGRIMKSGLWQYSRHPNYFGEVTQWWGIFLIALAVPNGFVSIIGPVTISFLILEVSGIPLLEAKYLGNKEFDEYKRKTSSFFPNFPKK